MKYDVTQILTNYAGEPFKRVELPPGGAPTDVYITVKDVFEEACLKADARFFDGGQKYRIYRLLKKIHGAIHHVYLSEDEVNLLRQLAGSALSVVALGATWDILDNPLPDEDVRAA